MIEPLIIDGVILTPIPSEQYDYSEYAVDVFNAKIFSKRLNRFLVANSNSNGYCYAGLRDGNTGISKSYGVHRIVMASHMGENLETFTRENGVEVDHYPIEDPSINGIDNLKVAYNRQEQYRESTKEKMRNNCGTKKMKEEDVCEILEQLEEWQESGMESL